VHDEGAAVAAPGEPADRVRAQGVGGGGVDVDRGEGGADDGDRSDAQRWVPALPAGAWADLIDRKRLLPGAQLAMFLAAAAMAGTAFLGVAEPWLILLLTFALGCGNAVAAPAWQAIQPDLVERTVLPQAAALNGLNMNVARAVGPAIGGLIWTGPRPRTGRRRS
jgi:hypothetical protein